MAERRIRAVASRQGRWWFVDLPGIGASTQARRSADIAWMARECAAMTLDVDDASIAIDVAYVLPDDARRRWDESRTKAEHARAEAAEAAALAR
ncbi:MAG: hypothetical protein INR72_16850, partial [Williamsia herbipolensis]|nr:hypothetical protein [Williamsia herbipolensis]